MSRKTIAYYVAREAIFENSLAVAANEIIELKKQLSELETAYGFMEAQYKGQLAELEEPRYVQVTPSRPNRDWAYNKRAGANFFKRNRRYSTSMNEVYEWLARNPDIEAIVGQEAAQLRA